MLQLSLDLEREDPSPNPEPSALSPELSALSPEPSTLNPEPSTLNPEPSTLNPEPSTLNPEPSTLNLEPGTWNPGLVFVRHPRARRYLIRVTDEGIVRVTIPHRGSRRDAEAFAVRERGWIERQLRRWRERRTSDDPSRTPDDRQLVDHHRALVAQARRELPPRLLELAARHGLTVSRVSILNQRWRWGSCSRSGHICLNWRLVTMPDRVRDYVLIHELMHLKRMDHSPKFWKLVAAACPEYQEARRWLRKAARDSARAI